MHPQQATKPRAVVSWSGGKDSALALWHARADFEVTGLVTTVTAPFERISMHGVRRALLDEQAAALGIKLVAVTISSLCCNADYEAAMRTALEREHQAGAERVICGDIFLEDVRRYREERLLAPGAGVFPIWGRASTELAHELIELGFRAVVCCVDTQALSAEFAGRVYDRHFLADLPKTADPCGENGEFHTFVFDGPLFAQPVRWRLGERVLRDGRFAYVDLHAD
jgi:uncharacterized protein (TIGR00290 family)